MKLRTRLLVFTSTQLAILGLLFAASYVHFRHVVFPIVMEHLHRKAETAAVSLASQLDVALGAGEPKLIESAVAELVADPDFSYVEVRDPTGQILYNRGVRPAGPLNGGQPREATESNDDHTVRSWSGVSLEGLDLGQLSIVFDTRRVENVRTWEERMALLVIVVWCAATAYGFRFSRAFVSPIRHMMVFSRKVAGGVFGETLSCGGAGELKELEDYLNAMTRELEAQQTERGQAAARAEVLQRELLTVSRMAGMAEVATGVLHNVGNVLTSLNVSVGVMSEKIRSSKVSALSRSVDLFAHQPGGLPAFLATDKGKLFPQYLASMAEHLSDENASIVSELESVARHVEHIKNIVAMQQNYARVAAHRERLQMKELVDDALTMVEISFTRHGIELVREYGDVPSALVDRHKVLQILLNLVSNARHAIKDQGEHGGRLTVRILPEGERIQIQVEDTGIGIPAANLDQIFEHGFTTKKDGHGFGLHAAANSARELGGALRVSSGGPGHGAMFTLELPVEAPERGGFDARLLQN